MIAALTASALLLRPAAPMRASASASIDTHIEVLRQCAIVPLRHQEACQATQALAHVANAGVHPDDWVAVLSARRWRPVFSATNNALKAAAADARAVPRPPALIDAMPGRFISIAAEQTFTANGRIENSFRLLMGALRVSFFGRYTMSGRRMAIAFETLRIRLLFGLLRLSLDVRDGSRLRTFIDRWMRPRGVHKAGRPYKKRPNVYAWCYADAGLCVAQGSSGSVAVWVADGGYPGAMHP